MARWLSHAAVYHWQELQQVWFLPQQTHVCHDKSMLVTKSFCHDKSMFVATKMFCHDKHVFVTKPLLQQAYFCHDKRHVLS